MAPRQACPHDHARFHSVQRLGALSVELWQCPTCKSTVAVRPIRTAHALVNSASA